MSNLKNKKALIYASSGLSMDDINTLTLLYEPIIGSEAFTLYLNFYSLVKKNNFNNYQVSHQDIYDMLNFSESKFISAREKLEGIGLLSSYENDEALAYCIVLPLPADQFVKSSCFGIYLNYQVGENNLKRIIELFKADKLNKSNFTNVTKSFDDVYQIKNVSKTNICDEYLEGVKKSKSISPINFKFDFDKFVNLIDIKYLPFGPNKTFETNIMSYATAYSLDLNDAIMAYTQSIGPNNEFSLKLFKTKAEKIYNLRNQDMKPKIVEKQLSDDKINLYSQINNFTIEELLSEANLTDSNLNRSRIADIYNGISFNRTVINMMIIYASKDKDIVPPLSYFEKMYNTMVENGVNDAYSDEKYLFAPKEETVVKKGRKYNKKKENDDPDWLQNSMDKLLKGLGTSDD